MAYNDDSIYYTDDGQDAGQDPPPDVRSIADYMALPAGGGDLDVLPPPAFAPIDVNQAGMTAPFTANPLLALAGRGSGGGSGGGDFLSSLFGSGGGGGDFAGLTNSLQNLFNLATGGQVGPSPQAILQMLQNIVGLNDSPGAIGSDIGNSVGLVLDALGLPEFGVPIQLLGNLVGPIAGMFTGLPREAKTGGAIGALGGSGNPLDSALGDYIKNKILGEGLVLSSSAQGHPQMTGAGQFLALLESLTGQQIPGFSPRGTTGVVNLDAGFDHPVTLYGVPSLQQAKEEFPYSGAPFSFSQLFSALPQLEQLGATGMLQPGNAEDLKRALREIGLRSGSEVGGGTLGGINPLLRLAGGGIGQDTTPFLQSLNQLADPRNLESMVKRAVAAMSHGRSEAGNAQPGGGLKLYHAPEKQDPWGLGNAL